MDDAINVGDTVQIVEGCVCGSSDDILWLYSIVDEITEPMTMSSSCGAPDITSRLARITLRGMNGYYPLIWLKKVPPLDEKEKDKLKELQSA
jgi:hypothetical protein